MVDRLAEEVGATWRSAKGPYRVAAWPGREALLVKPGTYMNNSGIAVADVIERHAVSPQDLLVVADDVSLPLGSIRIRRRGSDGGHNGLASIISVLGHDRFPRMRLGIGSQPEGGDLVEFVLSPFEWTEVPAVDDLIERGRAAVEVFVAAGIDAAMNASNLRPGHEDGDQG